MVYFDYPVILSRDQMKAVILAAGKGTRMQPFTFSKPKVLLPLANKPIIQYIVEDIADIGKDKIDEIFVVTNYLEGQIKSFFSKNDFAIKVTFIRQKRVSGTGEALKSVSGKVKGKFIVVNGDEVFGPTAIAAVLDSFLTMNAEGAVGAFKSDHPEEFGVLVTDGDGALERIVEKSKNPPTDIVNAGVYAFSDKIFEYLERLEPSERGEIELTDAIELMAQETKRVFVKEVDYWKTVSNLWDIFEANEYKVGQRIRSECGGEGTLIIGKNTKVLPGTFFEDNVIIGDNCIIGPCAHIRKNTAIGDNCHIGHSVGIKSSIIMKNTNVPHLNYIADSVIGENCNLAAGTITANWRHDNKGNKVLVKDEVVDTGKRKLGAFIADRTKTGIGTLIYPGMKMGPYSWTAPGAVVNQNIEPFRLFSNGGKAIIPLEKFDAIVDSEEERHLMSQIFEQLKRMEY